MNLTSAMKPAFFKRINPFNIYRKIQREQIFSKSNLPSPCSPPFPLLTFL